MQVGFVDACVINPKTMALGKEELKVYVESPVDLASYTRHGVDVVPYMMTQDLNGYFGMLNRPSYKELVKDFWVRAKVYDKEAAKGEKWEKIAKNPSLKGKTRQEMGLEEFKRTEIS